MNKTNLITALAGLGILVGTPTAYATAGAPTAMINSGFVASIGLIGPNGEVISYEKEGDVILLRVCKLFASVAPERTEVDVLEIDGPSMSIKYI